MNALNQVDVNNVVASKVKEYKEGYKKNIKSQPDCLKEAYWDQFRFDLFRVALQIQKTRRRGK